jgi:hypothetical protein
MKKSEAANSGRLQSEKNLGARIDPDFKPLFRRLALRAPQ